MDDLDGKLPGRCAASGASSWSDASNQLCIDGVLQGITQRGGSGPMCAFTATARQAPGRLSDFDKSTSPLAAWSRPPARARC